MDFFTALSVIIAIALLAFAFRREKLVDNEAYQKAVAMFIAAVVVHYPAAEVLGMIPVPVLNILFMIATKIAGYVLILLSFRSLCVSWGAPLPKGGSDEMRRGL